MSQCAFGKTPISRSNQATFARGRSTRLRARRRATGRSETQAGRFATGVERSGTQDVSRGHNEQREAQRPKGRGVSSAGTGAPSPEASMAANSLIESRGLPGSQRSWCEGLTPGESSRRGTADRGVGRLVAALWIVRDKPNSHCFEKLISAPFSRALGWWHVPRYGCRYSVHDVA